jgi:pfkB family carbohydrate kinase
MLRNDWNAVCWTDGQPYQSRLYPDLETMDRVGDGDSFASGLIYGLLTGLEVPTALEYGAAHGAPVMTTPVTPPWRQPPKSPLSSKVGAPGSAASIRARLVVEHSQLDPDQGRADGAREMG